MIDYGSTNLLFLELKLFVKAQIDFGISKIFTVFACRYLLILFTFYKPNK